MFEEVERLNVFSSYDMINLARLLKEMGRSSLLTQWENERVRVVEGERVRGWWRTQWRQMLRFCLIVYFTLNMISVFLTCSLSFPVLCVCHKQHLIRSLLVYIRFVCSFCNVLGRSVFSRCNTPPSHTLVFIKINSSFINLWFW